MTGGVLVGPLVWLPQCIGPGNRDRDPSNQKAQVTRWHPGFGYRLNLTV